MFKNSGKKKGLLVVDQLEVLDNLNDNLDKYVQELQINNKIRESRNNNLIGFSSADSEKNNENIQYVSDLNTERDGR